MHDNTVSHKKIAPSPLQPKTFAESKETTIFAMKAVDGEMDNEAFLPLRSRTTERCKISNFMRGPTMNEVGPARSEIRGNINYFGPVVAGP